MKTHFRLLFQFSVWIIALLVLVPVAQVIKYKYMPVRITPFIATRAVQTSIRGGSLVYAKHWVPISEISPNAIRAVITSEDNLFTKHHGFDFEAIKTAKDITQRTHRLHGGSTISQQCAKNVFLPHIRSYVRKAVEAYYTVLIELIWGKQRIMEVYLNVIEMGDGVYGIEAAAQKYFHCHASQLTAEQSALIAACLPNPRKYKVDAPSDYVRKRQKAILELMPKMKRFDLVVKKSE